MPQMFGQYQKVRLKTTTKKHPMMSLRSPWESPSHISLSKKDTHRPLLSSFPSIWYWLLAMRTTPIARRSCWNGMWRPFKLLPYVALILSMGPIVLCQVRAGLIFTEIRSHCWLLFGIKEHIKSTSWGDYRAQSVERECVWVDGSHCEIKVDE